MRALEEVALSYDQKAEEAAKSDELQKKLEEAEQKSSQYENVIPFFSFIFFLINNIVLFIILYPFLSYIYPTEHFHYTKFIVLDIGSRLIITIISKQDFERLRLPIFLHVLELIGNYLPRPWPKAPVMY